MAAMRTALRCEALGARYVVCSAIQRHPPCRLHSRCLHVSAISQVPLHVQERPCTLVLVEDSAFYPSSWESTFRDCFPTDHGMPFASLHLSADSVSEGIQELHQGLNVVLSLPDAVLVARGPLVSWYAQLYLESYSLQGLVLVDPILMIDEHEQDITTLERLNRQMQDRNTSSGRETRQIQRFLQRKENRSIKLEPNEAVPMLVLSTGLVDLEDCRKVSIRHGGGNDDNLGFISFESMDQKERTGESEAMITTRIANWIDDIVL